MYYVYILRCEDNSLYTGITTDVKRRYEEHIRGSVKGARYTHSHKPIGIETVFCADNKSEASRLEYFLKQLKKSEKEKIICELGYFSDKYGIKFDNVKYEQISKEKIETDFKII